MEKITNYMLLSAYTPNDLSAKVQEWIGKEFQPFGSPSVTFGKVLEKNNVNKPSEMVEATLFCQAVIKH